MRRAGMIALPVAAALLLAGCTADNSLSEQYQGSVDKDYVAGDGSTTSFPIADRKEAVPFDGVTEHGEPFSSSELLGEVTVVNFWYAGCPPCRVEAKDLVEVYDQFKDAGVKFLGVNIRDDRAQAVQFAQEFKIEYPSLMDTEGERKVQKAFAGQVPLNAVPTTLVLDREGRVAHRIVGQLAAASQLRTLVEETLAEGQG